MKSVAVFLLCIVAGAIFTDYSEAIDVDTLKTLAKAQFGNLGKSKQEASSSVFNKKNLCLAGCLLYSQCKKSDSKRVKFVCHEPPTCNC